MNFNHSVKAFGDVVREDRLFHKIGRPLGWYLKFHYASRLRDRLGIPHPWEEIGLTSSKKAIRLFFSFPYVGSLKGVFLDREYDCARFIRSSPRTLLDLGANIGFGTLFFSTLFPECEFASVEPDPRNVGELRRNLRLNTIESTICEAAVGPRAETLSLRFSENPTCSSLDGTGLHAHDQSVPVRVMTVPMIMSELHWEEIDLLKIDIEGAEENLLSSDTDWLKKVRTILIEIHPNTTPARISELLGRYGFKMLRLGAGREPVYLATRESMG